jgi:hypothetical protein
VAIVEAGYSSAKLRWSEHLTLDLWCLDRASGGHQPHSLVVRSGRRDVWRSRPPCYGEKARLVSERVLGRHDEGIFMTFSESPIERIAVAALPESVGPAPHVAGPCRVEADPVEPRQ